jgi:alkanesulfonate monooxygenase SsuD/methylene tetrahydromethanopterin reductase-like flavin-dependent oxidoreductase (luciferase family)
VRVDLSFGVTVIPSVSERSDPVAEARHAEELGFDLVTVWDHLHGNRPSFETWTLLTWIAASTSRISVGPNVLGLPYRNPVVTAKMGETLHRLSGGRLVLGLGAGGNDHEFEAFGLPVRPPREKIESLEEAVTIIRGVWFAPSFSFEGRHYRTVGAEVEPKPSPAIPIWLGTYGRQALELTGRTADGWLPSMAYAPSLGRS